MSHGIRHQAAFSFTLKFIFNYTVMPCNQNCCQHNYQQQREDIKDLQLGKSIEPWIDINSCIK